jgi:phosphate transport system substrate-binding protein
MEKMKFKKVIAVAGVCAMVTGMIAGCGNNSSDTSSDSSSDSKTEASSDWDASNDISVVSREDGSGTRGAFIELFGIEEKNGDEKVDNTTDEAQITNSTSVMLTTVAGDDYAIGYVSLGALDDSVKAVKIDGAEATADNVKSGDYKVSRPFNIATKEGSESELAKDFISFILSKEGQTVVAENGYISDDNAEPFSGSNPSGKIVVGGSSSVSPLMEKLIEAYKENNPDAEIELQTTDSTTGMTSAIDGTYDIGMASRELKDTELSEGLKAQVIATDGIAVIVNKNSTIDELSSDQVKSIYTGEILTWDEVAK